MKSFNKPLDLIAILLLIQLFSSCKDIIEPSVSTYKVFLEAPADGYQSTSYAINFWWDEVADAKSYHLQVVNNTFASPGGLIVDTVVTNYKFTVNLSPGSYQWRVLAQNGSSQTPYAAPRSFVVAASSITQQTIQLTAPGNNAISNQAVTTFTWGTLYGATKYYLEIDTNNFVDENTLAYTISVPGQQITYTFPKDHIYQWRVRGENDTAQSKWSAVNVITYDHTPPDAVTLASSNDQTVSLPVNLQWNKLSDASRYKLYVLKSDSITIYSSTFPLITTGNSYSFNSGSPGDKVYWKVSAIDAAGNEGPASEVRHFVLQ